ncbi:MAG: DNA recombination protein RmuC, partial [Enterobacteriaceae bacterium]
EPAFMLAVEQDPELIDLAQRSNIMLVSPTTLLVALRTINNLWRYEQQRENARQIADRAARLYDKLRLFVDDMSNLGQNLERAQLSYQGAMNKLAEGRGNLIRQVEGFRALGVEVKRPINEQLVERAQTTTEETEEEAETEEVMKSV